MKYFILYKNKHNNIYIYKFSYNSKKLMIKLNLKLKYVFNKKHISILNLSEILKKAGII